MITTGLAFSGGKDSWACLWYIRKQLHKTLVIWIDTGKNYPEIIESIDKASKICPHFVRVKVDREGQNAFNGIPSDVVPINWTKFGHECTGKKDTLIQSYINCCYENIGQNLVKFCNAAGIKTLIYGQRNDEKHKSTSRNGDIVLGIKRIQPIEHWTETQVLKYVSKFMELPEHFKFKHSSMDCYDCTAYRKETKDISEWRAVKWPELNKEYQTRKQLLDNALNDALGD